MLTIDRHKEDLEAVEYLRKAVRPVVVIAASAMCAGGRIQKYLKALLPDKCTDVVYWGYQSVGKLGCYIQRYAGTRNTR